MRCSNYKIFSYIFAGMVAKPDFKSGFETDSNPDLTKNYDPV